MDGVIYWGGRLLPGVKEFVDWLQSEGKQFLFLTNNSGQTPLELKLKLQAMGLDIDESCLLYTSERLSKSRQHRRHVFIPHKPKRKRCTVEIRHGKSAGRSDKTDGAD